MKDLSRHYSKVSGQQEHEKVLNAISYQSNTRPYWDVHYIPTKITKLKTGNTTYCQGCGTTRTLIQNINDTTSVGKCLAVSYKLNTYPTSHFPQYLYERNESIDLQKDLYKNIIVVLFIIAQT